MKFELKTEKENYSKSILQFFVIVFFTTLIIILCDFALKLGIISRNHKIRFLLINFKITKLFQKFLNIHIRKSLKHYL